MGKREITQKAECQGSRKRSRWRSFLGKRRSRRKSERLNAMRTERQKGRFDDGYKVDTVACVRVCTHAYYAYAKIEYKRGCKFDFYSPQLFLGIGKKESE